MSKNVQFEIIIETKVVMNSDDRANMFAGNTNLKYVEEWTAFGKLSYV